MISVRTLLACERVIRDAMTNQVSAIAILDDFHASGFPLLIPNLTVLAIMERDLDGDTATPTAVLTVIHRGQQMFSRPVDVNFQDQRVTRSIMRFEGFVVTQPGDLCFRVTVGDSESKEYQIKVHGPSVGEVTVNPA